MQIDYNKYVYLSGVFLLAQWICRELQPALFNVLWMERFQRRAPSAPGNGGCSCQEGAVTLGRLDPSGLPPGGLHIREAYIAGPRPVT